jgi:hypothetical protein
MIVYHFVNQSFGLKDIRERRLKISGLLDLNDPFDFLAAEAPTKFDRRLLRGWLRHMAKSTGVICFSRSWQNPVQWAHYGDRHRGLCLGFEIPSDSLTQVRYVESRPAWPAAPQPWPIEEQRRLVDQLLSTKFSHWSYEDEYRLFTSRVSPEADGTHYLDFSGTLRLSKVIVGARCPLARAELAQELGDLADTVEVFKARPAFKSFKMVRQQNASGWR